MFNKRFNKQEINLKAYIPPSHFRTVESFAMKKGESESKVEIELKDFFIKKLSFQVPWDGKLYAYVRHTNSFLRLLAENGLTGSEIKTIYLQDWDDKFSLIIETPDNKKELAFFVSLDDMFYLLENCCRIVEQK